MRHWARQFLHFVLVAVAIGASGANAYAGVLAAFDLHAHGHHGTHVHPSHDHHGPLGHQGDVSDSAAVDEHHQDRSPSNDHPCTHVHAHCCSSFAVQTADITLTTGVDARAVVAIANSHVPHGQLSSPLFRPPRAVA